MYLQCIVANASQLDANPAARSDVRRLEIRRRLLLDQRRLKTLPYGQPHREMTIPVMVVREHREHTFVLLDEKRGRAVRHLFRSARQRGTESPHPVELSVPPDLAAALARFTRCDLLGAEPGEPFDERHGDRFG